ncbi:PREDICTED: probable palmitoyltransferase ZDHHC1 [Cyprinodon variegatus]|uniref:probable palmitoyltransferase ZDHHC1 n=1 Tax=Cyprinodon variegatus TaxID=28743 RepID=UPI000742A5C7|nr:PREDICTED: probable palmitoyltransferase ZDHHC1 [Cyprinodon variegatus]
MDVCGRNPNRTAPVSEDASRRSDVPLCSRTNGWSWPPHPFQLLAWLLYAYFAIAGFGVFVPLLPAHWIPAGYICTGIMFACHLLVHVMAVSIDPADNNVRTKSDRGPVPMFDRSKHAHVIENCHCYLCQVDVGPKSKHCSACNKCVANFDHHCRWLNNCVGSRNYKLSTVQNETGVCPQCRMRQVCACVSTVQNETGVWFVFLPVAPLRSAAAVIPVLAAVTIALGLLSSGLLCHLLCFHIYLMWNRLSTYEYIVRQRHRLDSRDLRKPPTVKETRPPSVIQDENHSGTLGYTNPHPDIQEPPAQRDTDFLANGSIRSASNPVPQEEAPPTISAERKAHTHRHTQVSSQTRLVINSCINPVPVVLSSPAAEPSSTSAFSLGQRLPFPAFPLRASLPPLAPPLGSVQAAAPPAEYHSDSAESLEEIPVALAKLGSSSSAAAGEASRSSRTLIRGVQQQSPLPRAKKKSSSSRANKNPAELRFEMASTQPPSVFVSRSSGEPGEDFGLGWEQTRTRPASRTSLGSQR